MLPVPPKSDVPSVALAPLRRPRLQSVLAGLGWFFAFVAVQFAFALPCAVVGIALEVNERPGLLLAISTVASLVAAAVIVVPATRPVGVRRSLHLRGCDPVQLGLGLLLLPALAPLCALAFALARNALDAGAGTAFAAASPLDAIDRMYGGLATLPWPWAILLGCIVPAVAEEVTFRGVIGGRMVAGLGAAGGVLVTSFLFALTHLDPARVAATFILGVVLHFAFLTTRSLFVPIAMHVAQNAMWILGEPWALSRGYDPLGRGEDGMPAPPIVLIGLLASAAVVWALATSRTRWVLPDGEEWSPAADHPMPPHDLGARLRTDRPGLAPLAAAVLASGLFAVAAVSAARSGDSAVARRRASPLSAEEQALRHRERGDALMHAGDSLGAIAAYNEALALAPDDALARGGRGLAHAARDDALAAADDLAEAVRLVPERAEYRRYLGWAWVTLGQRELALNEFAEVLKIDPDDDYAHAQRGQVLLRLKRYREAHDEFDRALRCAKPTKRVWDGPVARDEVDPALVADLRTGRGKALLRLGHFDQALDDFADALRRVPTHGEASYEMAWLRAACPDDRLRDAKQAVALARALCDADGGRTAEHLAALAAALMEGGDQAGAIRTQQEALDRAAEVDRPFYEHALEGYRAGKPYRLSLDGQ